MSTYKTEITNGKIIAAAYDSTCRSEIITQEVEDTDFESIRESRTQRLLQNQVVFAEADKAWVSCPISNGDRIFIKDSSNTIHDTVASGVMFDGSYTSIIPEATSNEHLLYSVTTSTIGSDSWKLLDKNDGSYVRFAYADYASWLLIEFHELPTEAPTYFRYKANYTTPWQYYIGSPTLYGSQDGIHFEKMYFDNVTSKSSVDRIVRIKMPKIYKFYKIDFNTTEYSHVPSELEFYTFDLLTENSYCIDTSVITAGATPTHIWKHTDKLFFNNTLAVEKDIYKEYGTNGNHLYLNITYHDVVLSGRSLQTYIEFGAPGNSFEDITGQIYKEVE